MCNCVPGEVLRQCSAANPSDIYVPSMTLLGLRKFLYFMPVLTLLFVVSIREIMCVLY